MGTSLSGEQPGRTVAVALAVLLGLLAGVGGYTLLYAEGLSYMSADPKVCVNCHIMQPQYDSWQKASHHTVATCVDCHLPHSFIGKYLAKAENGYHHSKAFTLQDFHEPILIKAQEQPDPAGQLPRTATAISCTSRSRAPRRAPAKSSACIATARRGTATPAGLGRRETALRR